MNQQEYADYVFMHSLETRIKAMEARQNEIWNIMLKEFPRYFAGETALGIATNNETLGDEKLPDIEPIDLRSDDEKARGECFRLTDFVDMDQVG